jgi:hypothetical protein
MPGDTFFGYGPDQDKIPIDSEDASAQALYGAKDDEKVPGKSRQAIRSRPRN